MINKTITEQVKIEFEILETPSFMDIFHLDKSVYDSMTEQQLDALLEEKYQEYLVRLNTPAVEIPLEQQIALLQEQQATIQNELQVLLVEQNLISELM
jgi:hypothetical protein